MTNSDSSYINKIKELISALFITVLATGAIAGVIDILITSSGEWNFFPSEIFLHSFFFSNTTATLSLFLYSLFFFVVAGLLFIPSAFRRFLKAYTLAVSSCVTLLIIIFLASKAPKRAELSDIIGSAIFYYPLILSSSYLFFHILSYLNIIKKTAFFIKRFTLFIVLPIFIVSLAFQVYTHLMPPPVLNHNMLKPEKLRNNRMFSKPNIVLIVLDTVRADRLGCFGYEKNTTPNIDLFAQNARLYKNVYSPAVWTVPSHGSMFTGLAPNAHQATKRRPFLNSNSTTLAELLNENGYETVCLSNNPWISSRTRMDKGFDICGNPNTLWPSALRKGFENYLKSFDLPWLGLYTWFDRDTGGWNTNALTNQILKERDRKKPLFLFINLMEAHAPYSPTLRHRKIFIPKNKLKDSYRLVQSGNREWMSAIFDGDYMSQDDIQLSSMLYDASLHMLDEIFAKLIITISENMNLDNTVIILTADHGEEIGDHKDRLGHQFCVYNTLTHVPMMIRFPSLFTPGLTQNVIQLQDLFFTILDLAEIPLPETAVFQGYSLLNTNRHFQKTDAISAFYGGSDELVSFLKRKHPDYDISPITEKYLAIYAGRWKAIIPSDGKTELYDLNKDPMEKNNIVEKFEEIADSLSITAGRIHESYKADRTEDDSSSPTVDPTLRDQLRALGYVQ